MSRRWYERVALPPLTMTIAVQDFVDFWARHPKEFWDVAADFPDLRPRFPSVFLVARAPRALNSELYGRQPWPASGPRAWGILFGSVDIQVRWSDRRVVPLIVQRAPEPDEFVLRGKEVKQLARWLVSACMFEQPDLPGDTALAPAAAWQFMVAEDGSIPMVHGSHWFGPAGRDVESIASATDRLKYLQPMLLAISACNEAAALMSSKLLPPYFQFKLRPGRVPTIRRRAEKRAG